MKISIFVTLAKARLNMESVSAVISLGSKWAISITCCKKSGLQA
jgi:hypothetical protein